MIEFGPERLKQLNGLISRPLCWKAFHIAGTNGKGTAAARLSSLLRAAGHRTGRFTSPHLIDRWDCIAINDIPINEFQFRDAESTILGRVSHRDNTFRPSEFELLTATAFEVFNREKVKYAVVECGMGGLLDATNALRPEEVQASIITCIDYDHTDFLGSSLAEIAEHKAGIMKHGVPCFAFSDYSQESVTPQSSETRQTHDEVTDSNTIDTLLRRKSAEVGSDLVQVPLYSDVLLHPELRNPLRNASMSTWDVGGSTVALVYSALKSTLPAGHMPEWGPGQLELVIKAMKWPGRMEQIRLSPWIDYDQEVLLDGAHNEASATLLARHVNEKHRDTGEAITWLVAFSKGKDVKRILKKLIGPNDNVVITRFGPIDGMPWVQSASPDEVEAAVLEFRPPPQATSGKKVEATLSNVGEIGEFWVDRDYNSKTEGISQPRQFSLELQRAVEQAISIADGKIVITGSLYLVGDIHRAIRNSKGERPSAIWE